MPEVKSSDIHVLQNGVPRSGNVWLFYITRSLLREAGVEHRQAIHNDPVAQALAKRDLGIRDIASFDFLKVRPGICRYAVLDIYSWMITDLPAYIDSTSQVASHSPWNEGSATVYRQFSHVVYILRDPRNVVLSLARFAFTPFNRLRWPDKFEDPETWLEHNFASQLRAWVGHVYGHLKNRQHCPVHFVFYEQLCQNPRQELRKYADYLGLSLEDEVLQRVIEENNMSAMRGRQPNHTHKGGWQGWVSDLGVRQIAEAREIAGPLMQALGYPLDTQAMRDWSPEQLGLPE